MIAVAVLFVGSRTVSTFSISLENFNVNAADMGLFSEMSRVQATGGVLYRDLWDNKPPGLFIFTSLFVRLFGNSQLAIGTSLIANSVLFVAVMGFLVWQVTRSRAALLAALLLATYYIAPQGILETTLLMATCTAAAVGFAIKAKGNPAYLFVSGIFYVCAVFTKQPALLEFPVVVLFALWWTPRNRKQQIVSLVSLGTGMALLVGLVVLWAAHHQILRSFWFHVFESSVQYVTAADGGWHFRGDSSDYFRTEFVVSLRYISYLLALGVVSSVIVLKQSSERRIFWLVLFWVILTFCSASVARALKVAYYTQMLPPLILLISLSARSIVRWRMWRQVILLCAVVGLGVRNYPQLNSTLARGYSDLASEKSVSEYIINNTDEDDCLWMWGGLQVLNYLSGRPSCNSAPYDGHVMDPTVFPIRINRVEYMRELLTRHPALHVEGSPWGYFKTLADYASRYKGQQVLYVAPFTVYAMDRSMWHEADANYGNEIRFIGYDLLPVQDGHCAGDTLTLAMTWQQISRPAHQYQMFVQLVTQDEAARIAGYDGPPEDGDDRNATNTWVDTGEIRLGERFDMQIPADTAPGTYKLIAGLYDVERPEYRLPVLDANGLPAGNYAVMRAIAIEACE